MTRPSIYQAALLLPVLLPLVTHAAPPPYWPPYPPPQYYYPPVPSNGSNEAATALKPQQVSPVTETETVETTSPTEPRDNELTAPPATTDATSDSSMDEQTSASTGMVEQETTEPPMEESRETIAQPPAEENALPAAPNDAVTTNTAENTTEESVDRESDDEYLAQTIASAIQKGNFAEAYYLWRPLAEAGNADAQYGLGWMYHNGYGLAIDDQVAVIWWELAARQGHIDATFALGMLYGLGEGAVRRDTALAVSYYHRAARAGHEDARLLLRTLITEGDRHALQLMQTLLVEERLEEIAAASATVKSTRANVRKGPSTKHKILTTLDQGHMLLPLERKGRWLRVGMEGKAFLGWIHDSLVGQEVLTTP